MKRSILSILAVLALGFACSREYEPSPSSVAGPRLSEDSEGAVRAHQQQNCTLTQGFWKNHAEAWLVESLTLGGISYTQAQALEILRTPPRGDATYILAHQLIAAKLNLLHGADGSALGSTVADADAWLAANPLGSKPKGDAREVGIALAGTLDAFNNGAIGPGHCDDTAPTPTPTPTPTVEPTPTPTVEPTPTEQPGFAGSR